MPMRPYELSVFFDRLYDELHERWDNSVDDGAMTDQALRRKLTRMEEIGAILRALAEGQAVLTYPSKPAREPAPLIWLPWAGSDEP
jgi:hypothetical protein